MNGRHRRCRLPVPSLLCLLETRMKQYIVLYNPLSQTGNGLESAKKIEAYLPDAEVRYQDMTQIESAAAFLQETPAEVGLAFTGGDGTLNRVLNALDGVGLDREIFYFPAGSGNDFVNDLHIGKDCGLIAINPYRKYLPKILVNGESYRFINGTGHGFDGWCCAEKERLHALGKSKAYTMIAFEGLMLGKYKPTNAKISVDGVEKSYKQVWMAPVMFGEYCGGGVKMGPGQDRNNPEHTVTSVVIHDVNRVKALILFLFVTKGEGKRFPKYIEYRTGKNVKLEFDRAVPLQIDGEVIPDVVGYEVQTAGEE